MEAKDTVMEVSRIERFVTIQALDAHNRGFLTNYNMDDGVESGKSIAQAQAEITGRIMKLEGIRGVVEFIEQWALRANYQADPLKECWGISDGELAKLKEWGLE